MTTDVLAQAANLFGGVLTRSYVVLDFETAGPVDLKKAGAWVYAEHPATEILSVAYKVSGDKTIYLSASTPPSLSSIPYIGTDGLLMRLASDPSVIFIAHNVGFEKAIWRFIMVPMYGYPDIPDERWHDTMASAAQHGLPLKLQILARVLHLSNQKWMEGSKATRAMSKPNKKGYYDRSPAKLAIVYEYNKEDVKVEDEAHQMIGWQSAPERRVWLLDQTINERGIRLDMDYIRASQKIVAQASMPRLKEFSELTGGLAVTQRDQIMKWVLSQGVTLPDLKKETITALLGAEDDGLEDSTSLAGDETEGTVAGIILPENVKRALAIRQVLGSASIKKLKAMSSSVASDGRVHGAIQYYGATSTGRWAGRLFQPQNFPRGVLKLGKSAMPMDMVVSAIMTGDWEYVESVLGDPIDVVSSGLRHAIIASVGNDLLAGDYASIEARIVLALAGQHDKTAIMASGKDIYLDMAREIYGREVVKSETKERQTGKNAVLGCGFQMGWRKFKKRYAPDMTDEEAQNVIAAYREKFAPMVPKLWYGLENAALRTVRDREPHEYAGVLYQLEGQFLTARLPSGRKLYYYDPQLVKKAMPWDADDIRLAWTYKTLKMGRMVTVDAYGGLLTENVVQALARDLLVDSMVKLERIPFPLILTVHDEDLCDVPRKIADAKVLQQVMEDPPNWARAIQIPVQAETWQGERYHK